MVKVGDPSLTDRIRASRRRAETFRPSDHQWRRDVGAAETQRDPNYRPGRPAIPPDIEIPGSDDDGLARKTYRHTNDILDYFGFAEGRKRNVFLCSFNGDYFYGADIVRGIAFHMARFYGLYTDERVKGLELSRQDRKNIFKALALAVHAYGTTLTDRVVEAFGLNKLPEVVENYTPLRIHERYLDLVPTRDLGQIVSALNSPAFEGMGSKDVMRELGYRVSKGPMGVPLLYHKPNTA